VHGIEEAVGASVLFLVEGLRELGLEAPKVDVDQRHLLML
jgi:hypothetical protein